MIKLISKTTFYPDKDFKSTNDFMSDEEMIVSIARVSTSKDFNFNPNNPSKLITYLLENQHWSPFEMIDYTFFIKTSISISKQLIRHKSFSFQELSRRYSNKNLEFETIQLRKKRQVYENDSVQGAVDIFVDYAKDLYDSLIKQGIDREVARFILPQNTSTNLYMKGSLRSWLTFFLQRDTNHAQDEVRIIANEIKDILELHVPNVIRCFYDKYIDFK